jgi:hypothetical protein
MASRDLSWSRKSTEPVYSILNGDRSTPDCGGLIWSLMVAENVIYKYYGSPRTPIQSIDLTYVPASQALYYGSSSFGNEQLPGVSTVNQQYVRPTPDLKDYPSGVYKENFFLLTNAIVRPGFSSFI